MTRPPTRGHRARAATFARSCTRSSLAQPESHAGEGQRLDPAPPSAGLGAAESLLQQAHAVLVAMLRGHPDLILDSCSARAKRVQVSDLEALFAPLLAALFTVCDPRRAQGRRSALPPLAAARVGDRFQGGEQASERHHGGIQHRRDAGSRRPPADDPLGLESRRHAPPFSRTEQPCVPAIDGTLGQARRYPWCS